jgi:hypothetical protein
MRQSGRAIRHVMICDAQIGAMTMRLPPDNQPSASCRTRIQPPDSGRTRFRPGALADDELCLQGSGPVSDGARAAGVGSEFEL